MTALESPSVRERIAQIQLNAYANLGISPPQIAEQFSKVRASVLAFYSERPNYLGDKVAETPKWDYYIERNMAARFDRPMPTPFQEPYIHSWLTDCWHYHKVRLYSEEDFSEGDLILATAPTGQFNALAIAGQNQNGILLEDGLLNFSRQFIKLFSELLYYKEGSNFRTVSDGSALQDRIDAKEEAIEKLLDTAISYLVDGYITPPSPDSEDRFAESGGNIHNAIFIGFISFVIEHELHHLLATPNGTNLTSDVAESFEKMWVIFEKDIIPDLSTPIKKDDVKKLYEDHQEEILADFRAMNRLFTLGQLDQMIWPILDGGLIFFHIAEMLRWISLKITDPDRLELEAKLNGVWLSIAAMLHSETHPYPLVRRTGVFARTKVAHTPYAELLVERERRFIQIFNSIRQMFNRRYSCKTMPLQLAPKWSISTKALLASSR